MDWGWGYGPGEGLWSRVWSNAPGGEGMVQGEGLWSGKAGPWPHGRSCAQKGCGQLQGVWPLPEWEEHAQQAGTTPKGGGAVPRRGGATSTMGGAFPIGEGLCLEGACPHLGVGPRGGTPGYLPRGLDALDEAEEDDDPGDAEAPQEGQPHLAQVPDVIRQVQHVPPAWGRPASARPRHHRLPRPPSPVPVPGTSSTPRWGWCASGWC